MSGRDPSGLFPTVLGHEGGGVVEEVGPGVTVRRRRRPRDPALHPRVPQLPVLSLAARRTSAARSWRRRGRASCPTARAGSRTRGRCCTTTWARRPSRDYTVVPEIALAKIRNDAPLDKVCLLGCGITTGIGAVLNAAKVRGGRDGRRLRPRRHRALGVQGAVMAGAERIIGVDTNAEEVRARAPARRDRLVNPTRRRRRRGGDRRDDRRRRRLRVRVHRQRRGDGPGARSACHKGWGAVRSSSASPGAGEEIHARPFLLVTGRVWRGTRVRRHARPDAAARLRRLAT